MQVQKEKIRQSILEAALNEFYQHGFKGSSIRRIAEKAGVTPGNIYTYFNGKAGLFSAILADTKNVLKDFIQGHQPENIQTLSFNLMKLFVSHHKAFSIMMEGSEGTEFEHAKSELEQFTYERISHEKAFANFSEGAKRAFAISLITGILYLLKQNLQCGQGTQKDMEGFLSLIFNQGV